MNYWCTRRLWQMILQNQIDGWKLQIKFVFYTVDISDCRWFVDLSTPPHCISWLFPIYFVLCSHWVNHKDSSGLWQVGMVAMLLPSVPGSQSCCPPALPFPALHCTSKGTSWPSQLARPRLPAKSSFFHFRGFSGRAKSFLSLWRAASFQRNFSIRVTVSQHVRGCEAAAINLYNITAKLMFSLTEWSDQWLKVLNKKVFCLNPSISL